MNEREWRLRRRIDVLTDERDKLLASTLPTRRARPSWCIYCGERCKTTGTPVVCTHCRPLLELDPLYLGAVA